MRFERNEENEQRVVEAYRRLKTYKAVANEIGCSLNTVQRIMVSRGINPGQGKHTPGNGGGGSTPKITDAELMQEVKTMTRGEIAKKHNMHVESVARRMSKLGIHALKEKRDTKQKQVDFHWTPGTAEMVEKYQDGRFELIGIKGRRLRIKCCACGAVIERAHSTVRQKTVICDKCKKREQEKSDLERERRDLVYALQAIAEKKKPKICSRCGEIFYSEYPNKRYCSKTCKQRKAGNYRERARKYGAEYEPGITLGKVFARDGGVCQICGKRCDWNDNSWGESYGAMYPTIDHIRALANGGSHTWGNVQLAHAICNSVKRDTL